MGQLTQTTSQVQTILNDADASNVGNTSISDASDTKATAVKKSGFHSLGASASNAPSSERSVLISAVRNTAASGEIRYGQIVLTEGSELYWAVDDNGTLSSWSQAIGTATTQTLTNKTLTSPVLTTPQINDSSADHQYIFAAANLAADRTVSLPLLAGNDTFVFEAFTQTLTNKTLTSAVLNTGVSGTAIKDEDNMASDSATHLATQQSIKAYVDSQASSVTASSTTTFTNKTINASNNTLSNIPMSATSFAAGTGVTLSTNTLNVDAAQTGITSLLATDIKIGEDDQTKIDFETADTINFYAANTKQLALTDGALNILAQGDLRLEDSSGGEYVALQAPSSLSSSYTLTLPADDGSSSQILTTDGSGVLSWASISTAGLTDGSVTTAKLADDAVTSAKLAHALDITTSVSVGGSSDGVAISQGAIALKNGGTQSKIDFYCESSNAHYTRVQAAAHSAYSGNITLTLPASTGSSGQAMVTDGSGALSFATVSGSYNSWLVKTSAYTALAGDQIVVNSASAVTITLPGSASAGDTVIIKATGGGTVTIGRNSQNINSAAADSTLFNGNAVQLVYVDGTIGFLEI
jgi:hypothetical protein